MRPEELRERLLRFVVRVMRIGAALPKTPEGQKIRSQMFDSASSTGANYNEACAAESRDDFIHKMKVVLKELRETDYWLRLIVAASMLPLSRMKDVLKEADELISIFTSSINTARRNR